MIIQCHFHMDEDVEGRLLEDGSYELTCTRSGHPGGASWTWLETPAAPDAPGLGGLAEELGLAALLPAAVAELGEGWFEYGLVEEQYAARDPRGFARMVGRWGHTALGNAGSYSASAYITSCLGRLSREGAVSYLGGRGTGRWGYNADISWWANVPPPDTAARTSWSDRHGGSAQDAGTPSDACLTYVSI